MIVHGVYGTEILNAECIFDGKVIRHKCAVCGTTFYAPFGRVLDCICCSKECEEKFPMWDHARAKEYLDRLNAHCERRRSSDFADAMATALWSLSKMVKIPEKYIVPERYRR